MNQIWTLLKKIILFPGKAWAILKKDRVSLAGTLFVILLFLFSCFYFIFIPDGTLFLNRVCLPIGNQPPGFEVRLLKVIDNKPNQVQSMFSKWIYGTRHKETFIPISSNHFEGTDIVVKEFSASGDSSFEIRYNIADVVYNISPDSRVAERNGGLFFESADGAAVEESVSDIQGIIEGQYIIRKKYIMGTDHMGRDVLVMFLAATRASVWTAFFVTVIALFLGTLLGVFLGFAKGRYGEFFHWLIDSLTAIPALVFIIAVMFVIGNGFWKVCLVCGIVISFEVARMLFHKMTSVREKWYAETALALGIKPWRIAIKYILPGLAKPLLAIIPVVFCTAVLFESGLSFLGLGLSDNFPSWGSMIRDNFGYIIVPGYAYLTLLPGLAIILISFAFVVLSARMKIFTREEYDTVLG